MFTSVAQANAEVIEQIRRARPHWLDVKPASSLIKRAQSGENASSCRPADALARDDRPDERRLYRRMLV